MLKYLFLPPTVNLLGLLLGALLLRRQRWLGLTLIWGSALLLLVLSLPHTAWLLRQGLETAPYPDNAASAQAIVVLGGGRSRQMPQWQGRDGVNPQTLERLAEAARWQRRTDLPILVSGGAAGAGEESEAQLMARTLKEVFLVEPVIEEGRSGNTWENALFSAELLAGQNIDTVLLVSQAWHLPRAVAAFQHHGITAIPLGAGSASRPYSGPVGWMPRAYYLEESSLALHEYLGQWVYWLRARRPAGAQ